MVFYFLMGFSTCLSPLALRFECSVDKCNVNVRHLKI